MKKKPQLTQTPEPGSPLWDKIASLLTEERISKINEATAMRTNKVCVVMEDLFFTQNMSAVVRTADCMGVQDVYMIGDKTACRINDNVAKGAWYWVDIHRRTRQPKQETLQELKDKGYRLVATLPDENAVSLPDFDVTAGKAAFIFGNESRGISPLVREMADEFVTIPMHGFTESYNISVSVALCLYQLTQKLRNSGTDWQLSPEELNELRYRWMKKGIKKAEQVENEYVTRLAHPNDQ